jgi:hypothetical protein
MRSPDPNRWTINLENVSGRGQTGAPNPSPRTFRDPSNARQRLLHLLARYALSGLSFRETTRCVVQPYKVGTRYSDNGSRSGTDAGGVGLGLALGLALHRCNGGAIGFFLNLTLTPLTIRRGSATSGLVLSRSAFGAMTKVPWWRVLPPLPTQLASPTRSGGGHVRRGRSQCRRRHFPGPQPLQTG